jgi:hypothetical integral membrane protein (TIGR02206 family)
MEFFFTPTDTYRNFTGHHWSPVLILSLSFYWIIWIGKSKTEHVKWNMLLALSMIPFMAVISRAFFTFYEGSFTIQEELPLHLCRISALTMPFLIYFKNKKWINIFYFLIIVGTFQAVITADLKYTFPHYSYIIYWVFHMSLVWLPVAIITLTGIKPDKSAMIAAFILGNIYMVLTLAVNFTIGSNYFYTRHKPPGGSLLDFFGPWPIYLLVVEGIAIILFLLAYLPFKKKVNQ